MGSAQWGGGGEMQERQTERQNQKRKKDYAENKSKTKALNNSKFKESIPKSKGGQNETKG